MGAGMEKGLRRVTSADVARASGVSRATVSYVLNNDPRQSIPPKTREKVLQAANSLGYYPFAPARILRAGYSQIILAVLPFEQVDPGLAYTLKDLEAKLAAYGFTLIWHVGSHTFIGKTHPSSNLTPAVIVSYGDKEDPAIAAFLQQFNVPILWAMSDEAFRWVVGRMQVAYLVHQGWHRIVFAAPERHDVQWLAEARLHGVRQECAEYGLEPPITQVVPSTREGVQEAAANLLAQQSPPFGLCCYNDEVALAVLAALTDAGIHVPTEVAVIGCDDIPLAQFSIPPLTTIHFDHGQSLDPLVENIVAASRGEVLQAVPPPSLSVVARKSA